MPAKSTVVNMPIPLRVLGYRENGDWVAHCLETDLIGMGKTFQEAFNELRDATGSQYGFAVFKAQPRLFYHPAPLHIVETYTRLVEERLGRLGEKPADSSREVASFSVPESKDSDQGFALAGCETP